MRITPIDIRKQEFRRAMRGYDTDEVETFLAMVADEMEELAGTAQKSRTELVTLRERLQEYQQMEATMRETLVTVQRAADEKREVARHEAEIILKEAEMRAGRWIEEAHRSIRDIKKELVRLGGMRDSYVTRLRMLVQAQLDMLKIAEMEDETPSETLDMFEQRLEALTAQARGRVAAAGGGAVSAAPVAEETPVEEEEPVFESETMEDPLLTVAGAIEGEGEPGGILPVAVDEIAVDAVDTAPPEEMADAAPEFGDGVESGTVETEPGFEAEPGYESDRGRATAAEAGRAWHGWRREGFEEREPDDSSPETDDDLAGPEADRPDSDADEEKA